MQLRHLLSIGGLLSIVGSYFEDCSCRQLQQSTVCPTRRCEELIERSCQLSCPQGTELYYKTGLPWKRASNISCISGRYHADIRPGIEHLWHITCASPPSCTSCDDLIYTNFCPDGHICDNALAEVRSGGCTRVSCREGELTIVYPNLTFIQVHNLQCGEGGSWMDVNERIYHDVSRVTCSLERSCQTCQLPEELNNCRNDATCFRGKMSIQYANVGGCRIAACNEREFLIRAQSRSSSMLVGTSNGQPLMSLPAPTQPYDGVDALRCDERGRWTFEAYEGWQSHTVDLGFDVDAICYWPNCKRCWVEEMQCPPGEICSMDWLFEPARSLSCDVASCSNGTEMIVSDGLGIVRTVHSLRCSDAAEWVIIPSIADISRLTKKKSLFNLESSEEWEEKDTSSPPIATELRSRRASVTCKRVAKPCEKCADLTRPLACPGGTERRCSPAVYSGGASAEQCRVLSCEADHVLWSYHLNRWNTLDAYLECTPKGEWKLPGGAIIPSYIQVQCKYNGDCQCAGSRLGTSTACMKEFESGCDYGVVDVLGQKEGCSIIQCRYNGKLAIFAPGSEAFVRTIDGPLVCGGADTYLDQYGNRYTYLDSAVTCHSWEGPRHCARACTWAPHDSNTTHFTEFTDGNGCRNVKCSDPLQRVELHDTDEELWIVRDSLRCTIAGYWTTDADRGAMIFPYKRVDKNFIEIRCA